VFSGIGKHVAIRAFKLKPGTSLFSYTQVYISFFLSGLLHATGDYMIRGYLPLFSIQFFMLQALGISFEHFVIWLTTPIHSKLDVRVRKAIGYMWVVVWFCWTAPIWLDPMSAAGQHDRLDGIVFPKIVEFLKKKAIQ
jgi:Membrane bound O-acyl transferase family